MPAKAEKESGDFFIYTPLGVMRSDVRPASVVKFDGIVKQKYDYSCGAAVLATLFKFFFGEKDITEREIVEGLLKVGDKEKIKERQGFSMLDLKKYAKYRGYTAKGYRARVKDLVNLNKPFIVALDLGNYKHFVIVKGINKGRVFVADPALGNIVLSVYEFEKMWVGNILLVIEPKDGKGMRVGIEEKDLTIVRDEYLRNIFNPPIHPLPRSNMDF
ncbi:MAG: C39 family peptidase [Aquificae bacterium]|nr:C39 family peptidase [Aquificota bacterium]